MGKHRKHGRHGPHSRDGKQSETDMADLPSAAYEIPPRLPPPPPSRVPDACVQIGMADCVPPDKYELYQRAVQSPKGDISYLKKFFLMYVGGRSPLHLREDFCGTALICAEWVKGGSQRFATGLDLDLEALHWGLHNNIERLGTDACTRIHLFHGNVLRPISFADLINTTIKCPSREISVPSEMKNYEGISLLSLEKDGECGDGSCNIESCNRNLASTNIWPDTDIVCALNYSCCCLSRRSDLVSYFKYALKIISKMGGIFIMDLYGGSSSECALKVHRHFGDFTYIWEQETFDVVNRTTKISLHFRVKNNQKLLRHAFTYNWRLWSLPEVHDCLEEAGFDSVYFWMHSMPDLRGREEDDIEEHNDKYEEVLNFSQQDAWNAYVVAVRKADAV